MPGDMIHVLSVSHEPVPVVSPCDQPNLQTQVSQRPLMTTTILVLAGIASLNACSSDSSSVTDPAAQSSRTTTQPAVAAPAADLAQLEQAAIGRLQQVASTLGPLVQNGDDLPIAECPDGGAASSLLQLTGASLTGNALSSSQSVACNAVGDRVNGHINYFSGDPTITVPGVEPIYPYEHIVETGAERGYPVPGVDTPVGVIYVTGLRGMTAAGNGTAALGMLLCSVKP